MKQRVMLIRNVQSDMYGGGETYQLMLACEFLKNDWDPIIVTSSKKLLGEANKMGIKTVEAPFCRFQNWSGIRNLLFPIYVIWQIRLKRWYRSLFKEYQPEAVNVQSRDDFIAATKAAKKIGVKVFWTDHMDFRSWVLINVEKWYKNWIGKWILRVMEEVDGVIMISDFERRWFENHLRSKKFSNIITIKNGVVDRYSEFKKIKPKPESFIYLGRIVNYKGVGELLEAFRLVIKEHPNACLDLFGGGDDYEKYCKLGSDLKHVKFHGATDRPLKSLAEGDIFVLPSYREGLSLSLLDAMMMEKKIIVSNVDGNSEAISNNKTGLLVPTKDVSRLAAAMKWMLDNPKESETLAKDARKEYEEKYTFGRIFVEKMLPLYNNRKGEKK